MKIHTLSMVLIVLIPAMAWAQIEWDRYPGNIAIEPGSEGSWDDTHVAHPTVLIHDDQYHLWYAGSNSNQWAIGYARSNDGRTWEKYPDNPVLTDGLGAVWDGESVTQPCVIHNGTEFEMWYTGSDGSLSQIGHATSSDGLDWSKDASNPVLAVGTNGSWDDAGISSPTALIQDSAYRLWYTGYNGTLSRLGHATSSDGSAWTKHPSNPVVDVDSGSWDANGLSNASVLVTEMLEELTYHLWCAGDDGTDLEIGYATSGDGIDWTKHTSSPVLPCGEDGAWDAVGVTGPTVIGQDSLYQMWYTGYDGAVMCIGFAQSVTPADTSGNGKISSYDAGLILQYVVGLIHEFPAQTKPAPDGLDSLPMYEVRLPQVDAHSGETLHIPVHVTDATGLSAGGIRILYDSDVVQAEEVAALSLLSGTFWHANTQLDGEIRVAFASPVPLQDGGDLLELRFTVSTDLTAETSPLHFASVEFNDAIPVKRWHGQVRIVPSQTALLPCYPNPLNPETWIPYQLAEAATVRIRIYDALGRQVRAFGLGLQQAGRYQAPHQAVHWDGRNADGEIVGSGPYYYALEAGAFQAVRKMLLLK